MKIVRTIIQKEWMEVFRNRMVIFTVAFLPLMLTAIPLAILYAMQSTAGSDVNGAAATGLPPQMVEAICTGELKGMACFQAYLLNQFMLLFMLIPVAIPGAIAAYSIVGEKTTRSLEPLLATPITTFELLAGKCLAAVIPAIVATFAGFIVFLFGSWIITGDTALMLSFLDARWLIAILVVGPLLALLAVTFSIMVSSRVNDPRVAEQISMVIIVPIMGGFLGQIAGVFVLSRIVVSVVAFAMVLIDIGMIGLATRLFQRESILTRWR